MKLTPVIMSGGSGTRLWPVSRAHFPKQFCHLLDEPLHTMTLRRLKHMGPSVIVTSEKFRNLTESDIVKNNFQVEKVLYEPEARNTAAAIAFVCRYFEMQNKLDEVVGVFSSDNLILKENNFYEALEVAAIDAKKGLVVTLGVLPHRPETGFGYIEVKDRAIGTKKTTDVLKFHEKPSLDKATDFLKNGSYFWNAGIFIFKISTMIEHFKKFESGIWEEFANLKNDMSNLEDIYAQVKKISIDYAILEKLTSSELRCVTCDIGWSDLGSWDSLSEIRDEHLNDKNDQLVEVASQGNSLFSDLRKKYAVIGLKDVIIADTADALLICHKGDSQKVKDAVERLSMSEKNSHHKVTQDHVFEHRPWGEFEILADEDHFKAKTIKVNPGQKLSYQSHDKRAEHWIVVKGTATVVLNDLEHTVKAGEYIYIPQKSKHRVMNLTLGLVELVEVQVGSYFGEDDIVRYQDDYGRKR